MIDPSFWTDEKLGSCSREERLLFMGLISNADDEGRLPGHPALLKAAIFPYDDDIDTGEVAAWLENLAAKGLVVAYQAGGEAVVWVKNFTKHQTIKKPTPSKLPPPPAGAVEAGPAGHAGAARRVAARWVGAGRTAAGAGAAAACRHVAAEGAAAVGEPARAFAYEAGPEAGDRPGTAPDAAEDRPVLPGAAPIPPAPKAGPLPAGRDPAPALPAFSQDTLPVAEHREHEAPCPAPSPPCPLRRGFNLAAAVQDAATGEPAPGGEVPCEPRPPGPARPGGAGSTSPGPDGAAVTAGSRPGQSGQAPCPPAPTAPGHTAASGGFSGEISAITPGGGQLPHPPTPASSHRDGAEQAPHRAGFAPAAGERGMAPAPAPQEGGGGDSSAARRRGAVPGPVPHQFGTISPPVPHRAGTSSAPVPPKRREEKGKEREGKEKDIATPPAAAPAAPAGRRTTKVFPPDSPEYRLAYLLRELILANLPGARVPRASPEGMAAWCRHVDLLLRVDGREPEEVERVIRWCQKDPFWQANILSPRKLREKWETLVLQMRRAVGQGGKRAPRPPATGTAGSGRDKYRELYRLV